MLFMSSPIVESLLVYTYLAAAAAAAAYASITS
jgi:hypothetical protein